jgi:acetoin utilization deacetylase AcuC-like enzyme
MTIISAGFDAARGDPLGGCDVCISRLVYYSFFSSIEFFHMLKLRT